MKIVLILTGSIFIVSFAFAVQHSDIIEANIGESIIITLESNRTTGYEWQLAAPIDKNLVKFIGSRYTAPQSARIGAGGKEEWVFQTIRIGKAVISFKYVRPWEKKSEPAAKKTFIIIINKRNGIP